MSRRWSTGTALTVTDALAAPLVCALVLGVTAPAVLLTAGLTGAVAGRCADLQRSRLALEITGDLPRLLGVSAFTVLVVAALEPSLGIAGSPSLVVLAAAVGALFALLSSLRAGVYVAVTLLRRRGSVAHPVVIVGADAIGARLAQCLRDRPGHGLVPVGVVRTGSDQEDLSGFTVPVLGDVSDLSAIMAAHDVDDVIFAGSDSDARTLDALRRCLGDFHQVFVVPRFHELVDTDRHRRTELVRDVLLTRLRRRSRPLLDRARAARPVVSAPARPTARTARAQRRRDLAGTGGWTEVAQLRSDATVPGQPRFRNSYRSTLAVFDELKSIGEAHPAVASTTLPAQRPAPIVIRAGVETESVLPRVGSTWGRDERRPTPHRQPVGSGSRH